jgi:hypothetical protein
MCVREWDVSEVDAVHRCSVGAHGDVDVESGICETYGRVVVDDDPVPLGMIGEVDEDREGWPGELARIEATVQPPQQQVRVEFFRRRFTEGPSRSPGCEAEHDRFEVAARCGWSRRLSSARDSPGLPLMNSLNRVVPVSRSRTMWIVQRSPRSSADREIGQYWPYVFTRSFSHSSVLELDDDNFEVLAEW